MPLKYFIVMASLPFGAGAHAQVFKCKNSQGKVEYSDTPCAGAVDTGISNKPQFSAAANPNERVLGIYLQEEIAERDFKKASSLAVTPEHFALIREAQAQEMKIKENAKAERRERASRNPSVFCNTFRVTDQISNTTCH